METIQQENKQLRRYQKPIVESVRLVVEESILDVCKTTGFYVAQSTSSNCMSSIGEMCQFESS
jgi:hypothetical protein